MSVVLREHTSYLHKAFFTTKALRDEAKVHLRGIKFDTMVGTGVSGAIVVPRLAEAFGCEWMIVRKEKDGSHSNHKHEGRLGQRWIFVDDLIDSGATHRRVRASIEALCEKKGHVSEYVGAYLYDGMTGTGFRPAYA